MKIARINSVAGEHEVWIVDKTLDGKDLEQPLIKLDDSQSVIDDDKFERSVVMVITGRIEQAMRAQNVTHVVEIDGGGNADPPKEIDSFFREWREWIVNMLEDER